MAGISREHVVDKADFRDESPQIHDLARLAGPEGPEYRGLSE